VVVSKVGDSVLDRFVLFVGIELGLRSEAPLVDYFERGQGVALLELRGEDRASVRIPAVTRKCPGLPAFRATVGIKGNVHAATRAVSSAHGTTSQERGAGERNDGRVAEE